MSHFSVHIFTHHGTESELESLLEPFCEVVEPGDPYAVFEPDDNPHASVNPETGERGWWVNPNARWDWWQKGGRWRDGLRLKTGETAEEARVRDLNLSPDTKAVKDAGGFWEHAVNGAPLEGDKPIFTFKPEYYTDRYGTKENYVRAVTSGAPYAFITPDGEWHETGKMGWFGVDDATAATLTKFQAEWEAFVTDPDNQDLFVTVIDCHI